MKIASTNISINKNEISVYRDVLTKEGVKANCLKVLAAFKALDTQFTDLLTESLMRNKFTDERFKDAVNHVIDNCRYPKPSIADFVSYDKSIVFYTHKEMSHNRFNFDLFQAVRLYPNQEKPLWVSKTDFNTNNFIKWQ